MKLSAINELSIRVGFALLFFFTIFGKCWDKGKPAGKFSMPLFRASTGNIIKLLTHIILDGN